MARAYKRDRNGRFSSSGGKGAKPSGTIRKKKGAKADPRITESFDSLAKRVSRGDRVAMAELRRRRGNKPLKPARKDDKDQGWSIAARRYKQGLRP